MSLADLSINRPTFISCLVILMLALGAISLDRLGVDLFPDITFPVVNVTTVYPGAGPSEIETLISKPLEDELSTISGMKRLTSTNSEGVSVVIAEFTMATDVKYAEQQIRDKVSATKSKMPTDIEEPIIQRLDPADQAILTLAIAADLKEGPLFDLADDGIKPRLQQVSQVGRVEVLGGRKREIHVVVDQGKLKAHELSINWISRKLGSVGENIPAGKVSKGDQDVLFRTLGEFSNTAEIGKTMVNFFNNDAPTIVNDLGQVIDTLEDEKSRVFINGKKSLILNVYKQSGANTIEVVSNLRRQIERLNVELKNFEGKPSIDIIRDGSDWIRFNVEDVKESIFLGIILAVVVVYLFLANGRSTIITGLALPNSLLGAFVLMSIAGYTINLMTLLALSLAVGLLIDDAIVVRENIFRHLEMGKTAMQAALDGTGEVRLAVIATTLAVLAVFGPMGFLQGVVGQFFKQFGLTVCFAMCISLFDALTIAPMLSAYFAGSHHKKDPQGLMKIWDLSVGSVVRGFSHFQDWLEAVYERILKVTTLRPFGVLVTAVGIFVFSLMIAGKVTKTFLPPQDAGEFSVSMDLPAGTSLEKMTHLAQKIDTIIRSHKEVRLTSVTVGDERGAPEVASIYVAMVPSHERKLNTIVFKGIIREELAKLAEAADAHIQVKDFDFIGAGQRPFNVHLMSLDQKSLEDVGNKLRVKLGESKNLIGLDTNLRAGKPEVQFHLDLAESKLLGISSKTVGQELRGLIEGIKVAKFREKGREYDIRVRLIEGQRDLNERFPWIYVPNTNDSLIRLQDIAKKVETMGPAKINRQDRTRMVEINGDVAPGGGMGAAIEETHQALAQIGVPVGMTYQFVGEAENFQELASSMALAICLGVLFIYLVLSSLYESFVTPLTIMLALPLAVCGSLFALYITHQSLNIFSMIGIIMLLGVASKNSILLVDATLQLMAQGLVVRDAVIQAGKMRLRPILMTTMALIAGVIPIAMGLNEASRQRVSMGIAIIGGLISSTLLTLLVVPAAFNFINRFREWSLWWMKKIFT